MLVCNFHFPIEFITREIDIYLLQLLQQAQPVNCPGCQSDNLIISTLQAMRAQDQQLWVSNNRLMDAVGLGLGSGLGPPSSQQGGNMNDWSSHSQLSLNLQPLYSPMAGQ